MALRQSNSVNFFVLALGAFLLWGPWAAAPLAQWVIQDCWKPIYFGVKKSKIKAKRHETIAGVGVCTLLSTRYF